ncbi:hypothetical protein AVEN_142263-1, partial [Araneus ventricosus]
IRPFQSDLRETNQNQKPVQGHPAIPIRLERDQSESETSPFPPIFIRFTIDEKFSFPVFQKSWNCAEVNAPFYTWPA